MRSASPARMGEPLPTSSADGIAAAGLLGAEEADRAFAAGQQVQAVLERVGIRAVELRGIERAAGRIQRLQGGELLHSLLAAQLGKRMAQLRRLHFEPLNGGGKVAHVAQESCLAAASACSMRTRA